MRLWDPTTGQPVGDPLTGHTEPVTAVAFCPLPDGRTLRAICKVATLIDPTPYKRLFGTTLAASELCSVRRLG